MLVRTHGGILLRTHNSHRFKSPADARMAVFDFIEGWYNPHRRHSGIDYLSPMNFELRALKTSPRESVQPSKEPG
jgi:putative transposase